MERTTANLICRVFLPFAVAFFFSFLLRVVNALIAPYLIRDLGLGAAELGSLTSMFLLATAVSALPIGIALDRFGPRRVQTSLLLLAAAGSLIFAWGSSHWVLMLGRALIGVGFAATWTGGLKATVTWFRKEQLPLVNGWMLAFGSLGAIAASGPSDLVVQWVGWRNVFYGLAAGTLAVGLAGWLLVPDAKPVQRQSRSLGELRAVLCDRHFIRIAPLAIACVGTAWALQGLWAARWLTEVAGYRQAGVSAVLFVMACALGIGGIVLGSTASWLGRRGVAVDTVFAGAALLSMILQALILLGIPLPAAVLWGAAAAFGSMTVLAFAVMSEHFPKEKIGRANSLLSIGFMGGGFVMQAGIGYLLALSHLEPWGHDPFDAYRFAFGIPLVLQCIGFAWFVLRGRGVRLSPPHLVGRVT